MVLLKTWQVGTISDSVKLIRTGLPHDRDVGVAYSTFLKAAGPKVSEPLIQVHELAAIYDSVDTARYKPSPCIILLFHELILLSMSY
jgi:hypothetical protein